MTARPDDLRRLAGALGGRSVLVVGDVCLDEYLVGTPDRLSREAPVPVLSFSEEFVLPGAAANPARNIVSLGCRATMVAAIGDDETGDSLMKELGVHGIDTGGVVRVAGGATSRKSRVLARSNHRVPQQLLRLDRNDDRSVADATREAIVEHLKRLIPAHDAVLVSDYRHGIVSPAVIEAVHDTAQAHDKLATVDSQGDLYRFRKFAVVKANLSEAEATLGARLAGESEIEEHGRELLATLDAGSLLITRGEKGLSLLEAGGAVSHVAATNQSEVFDVTGAGDSVIAVMTLALLAGARPNEAATLANYAAGLVVRRLGNATTTREELAASIV